MFLLSLSLSLVFLRHSPITTSRRLRKGPAFQCPPFQCRPPCPPLPAAAAQPPPVASANCVSPAAAAKRGSFTTTTRRAAVNFPCWPMRWATCNSRQYGRTLTELCPKFSSSEPWLFFFFILGGSHNARNTVCVCRLSRSAACQAWIQTGSWESEAARRAKYQSPTWNYLTETCKRHLQSWA